MVSLVGGTAGAIVGIARPAYADCGYHKANVMGYDQNNYTVYGNRAQIYVNKSSTIASLVGAIHRSLFVVGSVGNDVEVGWTANNGGYSNPVVYFEYINRGTDSGIRFYTGYQLDHDTNFNFYVQDANGDRVWSAYVDGETTNFDSSPTMDFSYGNPETNSEHRYKCDSLFTDMYNIHRCTTHGSCTWTNYWS